MTTNSVVIIAAVIVAAAVVTAPVIERPRYELHVRAGGQALYRMDTTTGAVDVFGCVGKIRGGVPTDFKCRKGVGKGVIPPEPTLIDLIIP